MIQLCTARPDLHAALNEICEKAGPAPNDLDAGAEQAIAACGRDAKEAVKALIVANEILETQRDDLRCPPAMPAGGLQGSP